VVKDARNSALSAFGKRNEMIESVRLARECDFRFMIDSLLPPIKSSESAKRVQVQSRPSSGLLTLTVRNPTSIIWRQPIRLTYGTDHISVAF